MVMPVTLRRFTVEEVDQFPDDGNRYELLDGVLFVTPGPGLPHQVIAARLLVAFMNVIDDLPDLGVWSPAVVPIDRKSRLEPDLLVAATGGQLASWAKLGERWLAIEVSGSGSRIYDREYKRDAYLAAGVREVWLVDLTARTVAVSKAGAAKDVVHRDIVTWREPGSGREVRIELAVLFRLVEGE